MENIEQYRAKLLEDQKRLLAEIEENSKPQDFGSEIDSLDSEADEAEELANRLAIVQSLKDDLNEVEEALRRLEAGTYGICTECGNKISKEVLDVAPESALCEDCKKKML